MFGLVGDLQGDSVDAFKSTMHQVFSFYFPKHVNIARRQKSYLQRGLYKRKGATVADLSVAPKSHKWVFTHFSGA